MQFSITSMSYILRTEMKKWLYPPNKPCVELSTRLAWVMEHLKDILHNAKKDKSQMRWTQGSQSGKSSVLRTGTRGRRRTILPYSNFNVPTSETLAFWLKKIVKWESSSLVVCSEEKKILFVLICSNWVYVRPVRHLPLAGNLVSPQISQKDYKLGEDHYPSK